MSSHLKFDGRFDDLISFEVRAIDKVASSSFVVVEEVQVVH